MAVADAIVLMLAVLCDVPLRVASASLQRALVSDLGTTEIRQCHISPLARS